MTLDMVMVHTRELSKVITFDNGKKAIDVFGLDEGKARSPDASVNPLMLYQVMAGETMGMRGLLNIEDIGVVSPFYPSQSTESYGHPGISAGEELYSSFYGPTEGKEFVPEDSTSVPEV